MNCDICNSENIREEFYINGNITIKDYRCDECCYLVKHIRFNKYGDQV